MKSAKSYLSVCLCSVIAAAALTLTACNSVSSADSALLAQPFGKLTTDTAAYQKLSDSTSAAERFNALTLLARSQLVAGDTAGANATLTAMKGEAKTALQNDQYALVQALYLNKTGDNAAAADALKTVNPMVMPTQTALYYYTLNSSVNRALYQQSKDSSYLFKAYQSQKNVIDLVTGQDRTATIKTCASLLAALPSQDLANAYRNTNDIIDRGFYEYAIISASKSSDVRENLFADFKTKYTNHPVLELLGAAPAAAAAAAEPSESAAQPDEGARVSGVFAIGDNAKIAVLLPLSGRFAENVGEPARQGILAALQERNAKLRVTFYDTNRNNISEIVARLQGDGTALIIGPVLKPEVEALNQTGVQIPSVTFNRGTTGRGFNQWYFDLGPGYQGALAASKIYADGYNGPLVVSGADQSSERASAAFVSTYGKAGGKAVSCRYSDPAAVASSLSSCPLSGADAVYVFAPASDVIAAKPAIGNKPLYLTDQSYEGYNYSSQELALTGATLGDMPWLLTDSALKDTFMKIIPKAQPQAQRIFAAAYDAVGVALNMQALAQNGKDVLHGLTGDISLGADGLIETSPMWVVLGQPR